MRQTSAIGQMCGRKLDRTQNSVQQAMNEVHDEKLSQLVSLGGWLRGTEVLTSVVKQHFSNDGAELLHQPDLLTYFQTRLQAMSEFNLPNRSSNSGRLGGGKASNQYRQCSHFCGIS